MGLVLKGWFRDKDENRTCQEGCQKKQNMRQKNQEDLEAEEGSAQADRSFQQHQ
jgi:hypothetical protein